MRYCTTKEMKEKIERIQNEDDFHSLMAELSTVEPGHLFCLIRLKIMPGKLVVHCSIFLLPLLIF